MTFFTRAYRKTVNLRRGEEKEIEHRVGGSLQHGAIVRAPIHNDTKAPKTHQG